MAHITLFNIIKESHVSDKAINLNNKNKLTLKAHLHATKDQIKSAIKILFGVDPIAINTLIVKGKNKRSGRKTLYTEQSWKKVIVTLKKGQQIDQLNTTEEQDAIQRINEKNEQEGVRG
jgi:large subunit ribosomal protein L23